MAFLKHQIAGVAANDYKQGMAKARSSLLKLKASLISSTMPWACKSES